MAYIVLPKFSNVVSKVDRRIEEIERLTIEQYGAFSQMFQEANKLCNGFIAKSVDMLVNIITANPCYLHNIAFCDCLDTQLVELLQRDLSQLAWDIQFLKARGQFFV
jgi:hypothetical protein